ncbi:hypothetical protein [Streptococcus merionis]|uniref:hypothetical protein n=1 Tax=Streptococcus merionis TaxID=400065 RepID=UPI0035129330
MGLEASGAKLTDLEIAAQAQDFIKSLRNEQQEALLERFKETSSEFGLDEHFEDLAGVVHEECIDEVLISNDLIQEGNISTDGRFEGEKAILLSRLSCVCWLHLAKFIS